MATAALTRYLKVWSRCGTGIYVLEKEDKTLEKKCSVTPISLKGKKAERPCSTRPPGAPLRTSRLCTSLKSASAFKAQLHLWFSWQITAQWIHWEFSTKSPIYDDTLFEGKTKKWNYNLFPRQWKILLILLSSLQNVLIPTLNLMCYGIRKILSLAA